MVVGLSDELVVGGGWYIYRERNVDLAKCVYISRFNNFLSHHAPP